jgi:hypothetical protein
MDTRRLSIGDVERIPTDDLVPLITDSFDNLVTVAIADATSGYIPQRTRRLLRKVEWRQDWQDALACAAGELQVATERMRYTRDERLEATEHRLRRVRARAHEAAILVKKHRMATTRREPDVRRQTSSHSTALTWLCHAFPEEARELLRAERARRGLSVEEGADSPVFKDVHDEITYACAHGMLVAPRSGRVDHLLHADEATVRIAAADDAKEQQDRDTALRHPLMLKRWENALRELGQMTAGPALAESPHGLGSLPDDFFALPLPEGLRVLNARRFLAALQQRRREYKWYVRQITETLRERAQADPHVAAGKEARLEAAELMGARHPAEYAYIRCRLRPHEVFDGKLPAALISTPARSQIKQSVLAALADGTWQDTPVDGAPPAAPEGRHVVQQTP